jgi:hypothetical protein
MTVKLSLGGCCDRSHVMRFHVMRFEEDSNKRTSAGMGEVDCEALKFELPL